MLMEVMDEFVNTCINSDDEEDSKWINEEQIEITHEFSDYMVDHNFLQLKNNFIPKGLVHLE
jgi:hypothetical protein